MRCRSEIGERAVALERRLDLERGPVQLAGGGGRRQRREGDQPAAHSSFEARNGSDRSIDRSPLCRRDGAATRVPGSETRRRCYCAPRPGVASYGLRRERCPSNTPWVAAPARRAGRERPAARRRRRARCASASARCATCRRSCKLVWRTSPRLTAADLLLRLVRALLPVVTLYVGKLIIDEVVRAGAAAGRARQPAATGWRAACSTAWRCCSPPSSALAVLVRRARPRRLARRQRCSSEQFTNATSVRLMEHAATLDLEDFEDSELQDRLERARRQTTGRIGADEPALRPGAGHRDHRELRRRPGWSTRRG